MRHADELRLVSGHIKRANDFEKKAFLYDSYKKTIEDICFACQESALEGKKLKTFDASVLKELDENEKFDVIEYFELMGYQVKVYMVSSTQQVIEFYWG